MHSIFVKSLTFELQKWQNIFISNSTDTLQFEISLGQFIAVTEGIAKAIECLEATAANAADVYLYWLVILSHLKSALVANSLPDEVCGQIRAIVNSRYTEFFVNGPSKVHYAAFYLHPSKPIDIHSNTHTHLM